MVAAQHVPQKWITVMWVMIGVLAGLLAMAMASRLSGAIPPEPQPPNEPVYVVSPWRGMFCAGPYYGEPPYVTVGDDVKAGELLCRIETMRQLEVRAPVSGKVLEVLVKDGAMVQAGQPLFKIQIRPLVSPL